MVRGAVESEEFDSNKLSKEKIASGELELVGGEL